MLGLFPKEPFISALTKDFVLLKPALLADLKASGDLIIQFQPHWLLNANN